MVSSIVAMVVWIIVGHDLWEQVGRHEAPYWMKLYNVVTALTISVAVLLSYAVLFGLVAVTALVAWKANISGPLSNTRLILATTSPWPGWRPHWPGRRRPGIGSGRRRHGARSHLCVSATAM